MPVTISDDVLAAAHVTETELKRELALTLFERDRLTLAQASRSAEIGQLGFQALLAERGIPIHYGVEDSGRIYGSCVSPNAVDRRLGYVADSQSRANRPD